MVIKPPLLKETIERMRKQVVNETSKVRVARDFYICYRTVYYHTKDISMQKNLPQALKEAIREEIKRGKSKYQATKYNHLAANTVYALPKDHPVPQVAGLGYEGKPSRSYRNLY